MHRSDLITKLNSYNPEFELEKEFRVSLLSFVKANFDCFERSLSIGHVTGSAWIINHQYTKALLTHHKKLDRWLQLGGHADGETNIIKVASAEAQEESGLESLHLHSENIFDIDIHTIPARKNEPEHLHYDVRFLFIADENEELRISHESKNLAWIPFEQMKEKTNNNESILRMTQKSTRLFAGNK